MAFTLANLFVEIGSRMGGLQAGMNAAHHKLNHFYHEVNEKAHEGFSALGSSLAQGMGLGAGLAAFSGIEGAIEGVVEKLIESTNIAGKFESAVRRAHMAFGESAKESVEMAERLAEAYGFTKTEIIDAAAKFGLLGQQVGLSTERASAMSNQLAELTAKVSRVMDVGMDEAFAKVTMGLHGMGRGLGDLGVYMSEGMVKNEALRMGLLKMGDEMTDDTKVAASMSVMIKELTGTASHYDKVSRTAGDKQKQVWGRLDSALEEFGKAIMPVKLGILTFATEGVTAIGHWADRCKEGFETFAHNLVEVGTYARWVFGEIGSALRAGAQTNYEVVIAITDNWKSLAEASGWLKNVLKSDFEVIGTVWRNWFDIVQIGTLGVIHDCQEAGAEIKRLMLTFGDYMSYAQAVSKNVDNGAIALGKNLGKNLESILKAGFTGKMDPMHALTEGWKAVPKPAPRVADKVPSVKDAIDALLIHAEGREKKHDDDVANAHKPQFGKPGGPEEWKKPGFDALGGAKKDTKSQILGTLEFAKKLTAGAAGDMQKKQVNLLEKAVKGINKVADNTGKAKPNHAVAAGPA